MVYTGLYNADRQRQVTIVNGLTRTGLYSPDGQYNGVMNDGTSIWKGATHPCGALNVADYATTSAFTPNGSLSVVVSSNGYALRK